jgi:hypothetical protein
MTQLRKISIWIFLPLFLALPMVAQAGILPCNPLKSADPTTECQFSHIGELLVRIYNFMLATAAIATLYYMIFGAYTMVQGWLSGDPGGLFSQGVKKVKGAIWGLFFIVLAYLFVKIILELAGSTKTIEGWMSIFG